MQKSIFYAFFHLESRVRNTIQALYQPDRLPQNTPGSYYTLTIAVLVWHALGSPSTHQLQFQLACQSCLTPTVYTGDAPTQSHSFKTWGSGCFAYCISVKVMTLIGITGGKVQGLDNEKHPLSKDSSCLGDA